LVGVAGVLAPLAGPAGDASLLPPPPPPQAATKSDAAIAAIESLKFF
jgi:hypothetical protein